MNPIKVTRRCKPCDSRYILIDDVVKLVADFSQQIEQRFPGYEIYFSAHRQYPSEPWPLHALILNHPSYENTL